MRKFLATNLILLTSLISLSNSPRVPENLPQTRAESTFEVSKNKIKISYWGFINEEPVTGYEFGYENGEFDILYGNLLKARSFGNDYFCNANHLNLVYYDRKDIKDSFLIQLQPNYKYYRFTTHP